MDALWAELVRTREAVQRLRRYISPTVAEGILHDQERLRGERRDVTVLFVDAVGFTHLSASLDAELAFGLINDFLSRLVECVHRYDGVVDKFTGDGLMAVFGAPLAHENDPELAVRAAVDMQRAVAAFEPIARAQLGAPLQVRIGIHSGLAISGIVGSQDQVSYTVIGETVNLAARLESLARPGYILVSERVYRQTRPFFTFQEMGTVHIKGLDQPMPVYEVVGERAEPLSARGVAGVRAVFLGRDQQLERLHDLMADFASDGTGRLVVVRGEAGLGKSRLVSEWLSDADTVQVWEGVGLPYTRGVGYRVFRSLLQNAIRSLPPDVAWDRNVSAPLRPFLRLMLGLSLRPEEEKSVALLEPERVMQLTILALREWILGEAAQCPIVLVLEDYHWADDLSRSMFESLVNLIQEAPVLFCVITRPQPDSTLDSEVLGRPEIAPLALTLDLEPLSLEQSRELLSHLVDLSNLPELLVSTILERAEGNPFYLEEFVRVLIERGLLELEGERWRVAPGVAPESVEVPTTLRGLMMTRVDRLPEDMQNLLRSASVIGLQFSAPLLGEVERRLHGLEKAQPLLERLVEIGLLVERPEAGESAYAFRHILAQETIYQTILRNHRPYLHRTVAESVETIWADDLEEQVDLLAFHYYRAGVREKALHYSLLAAEKARKRFANQEAIELYSQALQLSQHLENYQVERWQAAVGLGQVEQHIGEYEEALALYRAALTDWVDASPEDRASVMLKMGQVWANRGNLEETEGWLHQGLLELERADEPPLDLRAMLYSELGWMSLRRGNLDTAGEWLEKGLDLVEGTGHYGVLSSILNRLGAVHYHRSEWEEAAASVERALEFRERLGDVVGYARSLNNLGILKRAVGDSPGAIACYQQACEIHEQIGEIEGFVQACTNLGVQYTDLGDWEKAEKHLRQSFEITQRIGYTYELAQTHLNLGRLYLFQGRWEECAHHLDQAVSLYQDAGARAHLNLNDTYDLKARLCLEKGDVDEAEDWARRCRDLLQEVTSEEGDDSIEWGRYEQLMGLIAGARGDLDSAHRYFDQSIRVLRACRARLEEGRTVYYRALLWLQSGERERGREELLRARDLFQEFGATADLERVEERLAQAA